MYQPSLVLFIVACHLLLRNCGFQRLQSHTLYIFLILQYAVDDRGIVSLIDCVFAGDHKIAARIVPGREPTVILNLRAERDGISICLCVNFPNIPVREPDLHIIAVHLRPQCPAKLLFLTRRRNFKFKLSRRSKIPHNAFL